MFLEGKGSFGAAVGRLEVPDLSGHFTASNIPAAAGSGCSIRYCRGTVVAAVHSLLVCRHHSSATIRSPSLSLGLNMFEIPLLWAPCVSWSCLGLRRLFAAPAVLGAWQPTALHRLRHMGGGSHLVELQPKGAGGSGWPRASLLTSIL